MARRKLCNTCVKKTKAGRVCRRRTCKTSNLPYCWQHLPASEKHKSTILRLRGALENVNSTHREELYDHMLRVYGDNEDEKSIIGHQLSNVFARKSKYSARIWRDPKSEDMKAHVIVRPTVPVSRLAREEFNGERKELAKHLSPGMLYVDSVGTEPSFRRRGLASVLLRSYSNDMILHVEQKQTQIAYARIGFVKVPELSSDDRVCMIKKK